MILNQRMSFFIRDGSGKGKMFVSDSTHPRQSPYERKLELMQIGRVFETEK